jgi:hypothetical protein
MLIESLLKGPYLHNISNLVPLDISFTHFLKPVHVQFNTTKENL